ncbi:unannotated protein [freshwater metagenome]|uniref:Unannotated protein n=1 Tax=freshwater metagenome TaxID=449393 RepID=A0A6J5YK07_9ZZZZ
MHELQQLRRELDVADTAGATFQLSLGESLLGDLGFGAFLHPTY